MHELSMTTSIVEKVLEEAKKRGAKRVEEVQLVIGKLTFLGIEQVRFSYDLLIKDTIMEGSRLVIEEREPLVRCSGCGYEGPLQYVNEPQFHIALPSFQCPRCAGEIEIIEGRECLIKSIRLTI